MAWAFRVSDGIRVVLYRSVDGCHSPSSAPPSIFTVRGDTSMALYCWEKDTLDHHTSCANSINPSRPAEYDGESRLVLSFQCFIHCNRDLLQTSALFLEPCTLAYIMNALALSANVRLSLVTAPPLVTNSKPRKAGNRSMVQATTQRGKSKRRHGAYDVTVCAAPRTRQRPMSAERGQLTSV